MLRAYIDCGDAGEHRDARRLRRFDTLVASESLDVALDIAGLVVSLGVMAVTGGQFVVALSRIAGAFRMRPTVVGALVGGFGTSIAELIVAALAALRRSPSWPSEASLARSSQRLFCTRRSGTDHAHPGRLRHRAARSPAQRRFRRFVRPPGRGRDLVGKGCSQWNQRACCDSTPGQRAIPSSETLRFPGDLS
jgi:hypothetical protein